MKINIGLNVIIELVKTFGFGFTNDNNGTYYYNFEPFKPFLQNYQELLVNYQYNIDWVKQILINILTPYRETGSFEYSVRLEKSYRNSIKMLVGIQNTLLFTHINKVDLSDFESLFNKLDEKVKKWDQVRSAINNAEREVQAELEKLDFYPRYSPKYVINRQEELLKMIDEYNRYYLKKSDVVSIKSIKNTVFSVLTNQYHFDPNNKHYFICPNGKNIIFKSTKLHPYKVFLKLYKHNGSLINVTELEKLSGNTSVRKVISDLRHKIKGSGLRITNTKNRSYCLTVT